MTSPEERPGESSTDLLAKLFDLRTFTGTLFLIFGVIVTIVGLGASDADINKAAGINLSLILGLIMLVMGVIFIAWMLIKPPEVLHRIKQLVSGPYLEMFARDDGFTKWGNEYQRDVASQDKRIYRQLERSLRAAL